MTLMHIALALAAASSAQPSAGGCTSSDGGYCLADAVDRIAPAPDALSEDRRIERVSQRADDVAESSRDAVNPIVSMSPHRHADMRGAPCAFASLGMPKVPSAPVSRP